MVLANDKNNNNNTKLNFTSTNQHETTIAKIVYALLLSRLIRISKLANCKQTLNV